jgi:hypothetical protein
LKNVIGLCFDTTASNTGCLKGSATIIESTVGHMNMFWSLKCLKENGWDYNRAEFNFAKFKASNEIPPEAFLK